MPREPKPCRHSEDRTFFDPNTHTVYLGFAFCCFLNKPCKPKNCPFANDPKYRKEESN